MESMKKEKICVLALGCKVSQYESGAIKEELKKMGYDATTDFCTADYYVINTCAVTNEAEHKSRSYMTKVLNKNPNARILICGCASEHNKEQFLKNPSVIFVCGNSGKFTIPMFLDNFINNEKSPQKVTIPRDYSSKLTKDYEDFATKTISRTRAYLKIQDGCDNFCSYCLIPFVRGRSRSRDINDLVSEAMNLSKDNQEIVLTGINMSDYKIDGKLALREVMERLKNVDARIRISSLEVNIIDEDFMKTLASMPNFCPQFHLSMQSGCDRILSLMNRHYNKSMFLSKIDLIKKYFKDASITTDVIVGFPTETEEDFLETVDTIKKAKFFKMHIFPYSIRNGTKASRMVQVNGNIKKQRLKELEKLDAILHDEYLKQMKGKVQYVLTEREDDGYVIGYTETYIKIYLPKPAKNYSLVKIIVGDKYKDGALGTICE